MAGAMLDGCTRMVVSLRTLTNKLPRTIYQQVARDSTIGLPPPTAADTAAARHRCTCRWYGGTAVPTSSSRTRGGSGPWWHSFATWWNGCITPHRQRVVADALAALAARGAVRGAADAGRIGTSSRSAMCADRPSIPVPHLTSTAQLIGPLATNAQVVVERFNYEINIRVLIPVRAALFKLERLRLLDKTVHAHTPGLFNSWLCRSCNTAVTSCGWLGISTIGALFVVSRVPVVDRRTFAVHARTRAIRCACPRGLMVLVSTHAQVGGV